MSERRLTENMRRWLEALRRDPEAWVVEVPTSTGRALVRRGLAEEKRVALTDPGAGRRRTTSAFRATDAGG